MRVLAIDPGLQASGYAFGAEGRVEAVGLLRAPPKVRDLHGRIRHQLAELWAVTDVLRPEVVVVERMFHRPKRRGMPYIDPNDLISVQALASALAYAVVPPERVGLPLPHEWKPKIPRDVEQSRTRMALRPDELLRVEAVLPASLRKEAWSATGILLAALGRAHLPLGGLGPLGTFVTGTTGASE
jgi:hypothetical protein